MAELNGETPVDGSYNKHLQDVLGEDDDSDDSQSNAHESVRVDPCIPFGTMTDHVPSPHSVKPNPTRELLSPLALVTILAKTTSGPSGPSISPVTIVVQSPQPARQPQAPL